MTFKMVTFHMTLKGQTQVMDTLTAYISLLGGLTIALLLNTSASDRFDVIELSVSVSVNLQGPWSYFLFSSAVWFSRDKS